MYVILTRDGMRVAIFARFVVAIEADGPTTSVVVMADGSRYFTSMQAEIIIKAVVGLVQNEMR